MPSGFRFVANLLRAAFLLGLIAITCLGQEYRARIQGLVTDESQSAVPDATVTLLNTKTGIQTVRKTSGTGLYLFDLVDPGTYTLSVEAPGFGKFVQENIGAEMRADITVNATLKTGAVQESVTVSGTPTEVEFNSSNQDQTLDSTMVQETPRFDRNPFKLTLLAPEAINTRGEVLPFLSWSANSVDLGGDTNLKNDLQVDGSPVGLGHKFSLPPNMDAVQEVTVSQNSVDAEQGHSAGGVISMTTKAGTNEWHGDMFYLGRYPWLNAEADRTRFSQNAQRQHTIGATLGNPILKNKLFNFASFEYWKVGAPGAYATTVPTSLEAQGNFSQSYNVNGGLRTVYDPWSTLTSQSGVVTRSPFPGNIVPSSRFDPTAAPIMKLFWPANNPGDNITGVNNFKHGYTDAWDYYNWADRVDWNINEKWKVFGRVGRYHTTDIVSNPTPNNSPLYQPTGSLRTAVQVAGDAVWTISPNTILDIHGDYHSVVDAYVSTPLGGNGWGSIWGSNNWYQPYFVNSPGLPVYYPDLNIGGANFGGRGFYWDQRPKGEALNVKISHQVSSHFLKAGFEYRESYGPVFVSNTSQFFFNTAVTADTYSNPNTLVNGDPWATFLLGALDSQTEMVGGPVPKPITNFYGMYFQDDWKITRKLTLNLGLRNEYEAAWHDSAHTLSQAMDLSAAVPAIQANPPSMPALASQLVGNNFWHFTGAWRFTTSGHPGMWDPPALALAPRAGFAYAIDDKTALRFGYARYVTPTEYNFTSAPVAGFEDINFLEPPNFGMFGYQFAAPLLQGVPQETFSNPYPANINPLLPNFGPIAGKALGTNVGRGGENLLWYPQNFSKAYNDRINVNIQRQLPGGFVAGFTYFLNLGHQHYTKQLNAINPSILQQNSPSYLNQSVPNPFYHYLDTTVNNGPYYYQPTLPLSSLLTPYPMYGPLYQIGTCCSLERYHQLQARVQRSFRNGFNFLFTYVYINEKSQINNFNDLTYYNNTFQWQASNQPRHRLNTVFTYELPFGKGKQFLPNASRLVDAAVGGWKFTPVIQFISGDYPQFTQTLIVTGNPCVSNPSPGQWFNKSAFAPVPANTYVLRNNPLQYGCLKGPSFFDVDASLAKDIHITEKWRAELRMTAYNALNNLQRGDPDTNIYDSTFGQALYQGSPGGTFGAQGGTSALVSGRQVELMFKILW